MSANPIPFLRKVAKVEAVSFLVLLCVAMPLKYFAGMPMAVKICGWIHGLLFIVFCFALLQAMTNARWSFSRAVPIFISALLPFGPLVLDRRMAAYEQEYAADPSVSGR